MIASSWKTVLRLARGARNLGLVRTSVRGGFLYAFRSGQGIVFQRSLSGHVNVSIRPVRGSRRDRRLAA